MLKRTKKEIVYIKKKRVEVCDGGCVWCPPGVSASWLEGFKDLTLKRDDEWGFDPNQTEILF